MLQGSLSLHDIRDVEVFCAAIIARFELTHHEREDLLTYLIEECWILSERYERERGAGSFASWSVNILRRRVGDLDRQRFRTRWVFADRVYERPRPQFVPIDDRMGDAVRVEPVDATPDRSPDLMRVLGAGDSESARGRDQVGASADGIAA